MAKQKAVHQAQWLQKSDTLVGNWRDILAATLETITPFCSESDVEFANAARLPGYTE
jgi:hypothetical protein